MKSIYDLRKWGRILHLLPEDRFWELVDAIEAEVAERYVELPLDADGVPVRIGDVIAYVDNTRPKEVVALVPPSMVMVEDGPRYVDMCRHYKPPTVEDVLFEFAQFWSDEELTDIEHLQPYIKQTLKEYAAMLRLVDDGKEQ